jgi:hypothetical protein
MVIKRTTTSTSSASKKTTGKSSSGDLRAMIAKKAYELYVKRGYSHGNDKNDWYEAEKYVRSSMR